MKLDLDALAARLRARSRLRFSREGFRESAVLVPIVVEEQAPSRLLFIVRDGALRKHAGQVAFPGGAREPGDDFPAGTALREAEEELGLPAAAATVLGALDDVPTPTGFVITPVVARVAGPIALTPSPAEVADTFLAEVSSLRDPERHSHDGEREFLGVTYIMHQYRWQAWNIWGATARIVHQLLGLLDGEDRT